MPEKSFKICEVQKKGVQSHRGLTVCMQVARRHKGLNNFLYGVRSKRSGIPSFQSRKVRALLHPRNTGGYIFSVKPLITLIAFPGEIEDILSLYTFKPSQHCSIAPRFGRYGFLRFSLDFDSRASRRGFSLPSRSFAYR